MPANKLRFYLAYWSREPREGGYPGKYHVGLLLVPKKPKSDAVTTRRYHAVNPIDPDTKAETWKFETRITRARTNKLAGLVLLGKVAPNFTVEFIEEILNRVPVPTAEEAKERNWRCRHWALEAIESLVAERILPALPGSAQETWDTGRRFIDSKATSDSDWLFTCDTSGKELNSEIRS